MTGFTGIQTEAVLDTPGFLRIIDPGIAPLNNFMSGLGMPGFTGYFGMTDIGAPKAGETVVVSAAAGAVGSIASQMAKLAGARVIGIAGGPEKCALLSEKFGLDAAIDYKAGSIKDPEDHSRRMLEFVEFPIAEDTISEQLNTVQLKRLDLARALASRPKLLFLDELASGLSEGELKEIMSLILKIRSKSTSR